MHNEDMYDILIDGLEKVSSAASYLGVSRSFIYKLIANGAQTNLVQDDFVKSIHDQ